MSACSVPECTKPSRSKGMCSMHYSRLARRGSVDAGFVRGRTYVTDGGYVCEHAPGHPLASPRGRIYQHRRVLFDAIGPGEHACHWCGVTVAWIPGPGEALVSDHVNGDKQDNRPENLVPACNTCNVTRGTHYKLLWTSCPNGHPYTDVYITPQGARRCRPCRRSRQAAYEARRRQETAS